MGAFKTQMETKEILVSFFLVSELRFSKGNSASHKQNVFFVVWFPELANVYEEILLADGHVDVATYVVSIT